MAFDDMAVAVAVDAVSEAQKDERQGERCDASGKD